MRDLIYKALDGYAAPDECDEILKVLDAAGYVIAPKEPTGAQCVAGANAHYEAEKDALKLAMETDTLTHRGTHVRKIYARMLDAR